MKFSLHRYAAIILACSLIATNISADTDDVVSRLSFSISGGASKGAYEAGLNWAFVKAVRNSPEFLNITGAQLYPFDVGSITGASAGGINTILSGLSWCSLPEDKGGINNSIDDNVFRDIWLNIDINTLLPEHADSEIYRPDDAVFSRNDFYSYAKELRDKWNRPSFRKDCRVPMAVTVTRIDPEILTVGKVEVQNQRFYIPFELRVTDENNIKFFFDPEDYPRVEDPAMILMPREHSAPALSIDDERMIEVVATTSAFPMAFGRKRLQYCKLSLKAANTEKKQEAPVKKNTQLICPYGYELGEAEFADGGLFDNLPIGVARMLAEENARFKDEKLPITYIYIDPDRKRYQIPEIDKGLACDSDNPPEACRTMVFNAAAESKLLLGFLGTARRYELYRELTSDDWQLNLSEISYKFADFIQKLDSKPECQDKFPIYNQQLECAEVLSRAGELLEIAYDRTKPVIKDPYSVERLRNKGIIDQCEILHNSMNSQKYTACTFDIAEFREQLANAMRAISKKLKVTEWKIYNDIERSRESMRNDRMLRVSSRGAPITGTLLGDFGSFLEYKFREYDYYVGIYDGIVMIAFNMCNLHFSSAHQSKELFECIDTMSQQMYPILGVDKDPKARYVFARLAQREFGQHNALRFAYEPMPDIDNDMHIIHNALEESLSTGETTKTFFQHLKVEGFTPTPEKGAADSRRKITLRQEEKPLLEQIIDDPDTWAHELTRRFTTRLVYLETETNKIYKQREPDPSKQQSANTALMGSTAFVLQSGTYRYPASTFSPSTAPDNWFWRNVIPYELAFDLSEGDLLLTWQPTWSLSKKDLAVIRGSIGFPGGLLSSSADTVRENYFALGLGYTRRTSSAMISSFGITPTWYHSFKDPVVIDQDTIGGDIHVSFFKDRLRVGLGTRDLDNVKDTWFLSVGITDIPGMVYWLTR